MGEKAPYVVTLFVAALSWLTIHTADRLSSIQFVEYRVALSDSEGRHGIEVRLRNITVASKFDCFLLTFATRQGETLKFGDPKGQQITLRGTVLSTLTVIQTEDNEWDIKAENLAPGADIALFVPATGAGTPAILTESCRANNASSEDGVAGNANNEKTTTRSRGESPVLIQRSLTTRFVEYEIRILWSGLGLWLIVMIVLMRISYCEDRKNTTGNPAETDLDITG
jgi:hypothetical protein